MFLWKDRLGENMFYSCPSYVFNGYMFLTYNCHVSNLHNVMDKEQNIGVHKGILANLENCLNSLLLISFRQSLMTQMEQHKIPYQLTEVVLLQAQLPSSHRISLLHPSDLLTFHHQQIHRRQMYNLYLHVPNLLPRQW